MYKTIGFISIFVFFVSVVPVFAQNYYVQSAQAPLWHSPSFAAKKIVSVPKGETITAQKEQKGWVKVNYKDKTGWMLKLMLSNQPPAQTDTADQKAQDLVQERSRLRPSAFASTAAARGLMEKQAGFGNKLKMDFKAVEAMERYRVSEKEAWQFLAERKKP